MQRNQNFVFERKWPTSLGFSFYNSFLRLSFFSFSYLLLQLLTYLWAFFQFKNFQESIIEIENSYHRVANCTWGKVSSDFFTPILEHLPAYSCSVDQITAIWVSLETPFPPAELEHKWYQFWYHLWNKGQRSSWLVTAGTGINGLIRIWFLFIITSVPRDI